MSNATERDQERGDEEFFDGHHFGKWVGELIHTPETIPKPWYKAWMFWTKPDIRQILIDPVENEDEAEKLLAQMVATLSRDKQQQFAQEPDRRDRVLRRIRSSLKYHRTSSV